MEPKEATLYFCPIKDSGCGQILAEQETIAAGVWGWLRPKTRVCRWCGHKVELAKCSFDGCTKEARHLDWDRLQDVEVAFCGDHCYNGQIRSLIREQQDIQDATKDYRRLNAERRKTS